MKEVLLAISFLLLEYEEINSLLTELQIKNQWLGFEPAEIEEIQNAEIKFKINLPEDYINFLKLTNGFSSSNSIEPTFMKIQDIDYLKNIEPFAIECYEHLPELENCILIAGKDEEQYFLLIPPNDEFEKWRYWKFANWIPGEYEFENLECYFKDVLQFMEEEFEDKNN